MWLYGIVFNLTLRDIQEEFIISRRLRKIVGLKRVPCYTTICRAAGKLTEEDAEKIFEKSKELFENERSLLACDSTGIRTDNRSSYYEARSGKKRKCWYKIVYLVDTNNLSTTAQRISSAKLRCHLLS